MTTPTPPSEGQLEQSRALFFQGISHFETQQFEDACRCFKDALELAPGRPSIIGNLGITLFHLQRLDEAIPLLRQATAADPSNADAWVCLGLVCETRGAWQDMVDALTHAVQLRPQPSPLWLTLGMGRLRMGLVADALAAFDRSLEIDPEFAPAWTERGSLLRELDRLDESATCFEQALAHGGDVELNRYYLAAVRQAAIPVTPPRRYVEGLFDGYATEFEDHLVGQLGYRAHEILLQPLLQSENRYRHVLDLGCGTGLCGKLIASRADRIDGIDVSGAMLVEARKAGCYRELIHADIGEFLNRTDEMVDLVLAADVFIYVGALSGVMKSLRRILVPGGRLAFTVEPTSDGSELQLSPSLRYAHSEAYVRRVAAENDFRVLAIEQRLLREDQRNPVSGLYCYLG